MQHSSSMLQQTTDLNTLSAIAAQLTVSRAREVAPGVTTTDSLSPSRSLSKTRLQQQQQQQQQQQKLQQQIQGVLRLQQQQQQQFAVAAQHHQQQHHQLHRGLGHLGVNLHQPSPFAQQHTPLTQHPAAHAFGGTNPSIGHQPPPQQPQGPPQVGKPSGEIQRHNWELDWLASELVAAREEVEKLKAENARLRMQASEARNGAAGGTPSPVPQGSPKQAAAGSPSGTSSARDAMPPTQAAAAAGTAAAMTADQRVEMLLKRQSPPQSHAPTPPSASVAAAPNLQQLMLQQLIQGTQAQTTRAGGGILPVAAQPAPPVTAASSTSAVLEQLKQAQSLLTGGVGGLASLAGGANPLAAQISMAGKAQLDPQLQQQLKDILQVIPTTAVQKQ